eukprot:GABV01000921.1.p1 GENE.GABV01000921.1~~GABV01000921.1.p1  ORF type:complete len:308 (-),score=123.55 GABV01000921.1:45-968(-)
MFKYEMYHWEHKSMTISRLSREHNRLVRSIKVMDLANIGFKHVNRVALSWLKEILAVGQAHYPESLDKIVLTNTPSMFNVLWAIVRPVLHERTVSKIVMLGADYKAVMESHMDPKFIPDFLGGPVANLVPIHDPDADYTTQTVSRGDKFQLEPIQIPSPAHVCAWTFKTKDKDIGFEAFFISESTGDKHTVAEAKRFNSHKEMIAGEFQPSAEQGAGKLCLVWDNSFSRFTSKTLMFEFSVTESLSEEQLEEVHEVEEEVKEEEESAGAGAVASPVDLALEAQAAAAKAEADKQGEVSARDGEAQGV